MMNSQEMDLLLGRLAVHFQVLTKEQVAEALRWRRDSGSQLELGQFLVAEGFVSPEVFAKLERARQQYLMKQGESGATAAAPAAPAPPAAPAAPAFAPPAPSLAAPAPPTPPTAGGYGASPAFAPSPLVYAQPEAPPRAGAATEPMAVFPFDPTAEEAAPAGFQIDPLPTPFDPPAAVAPAAPAAFAMPAPAPAAFAMPAPAPAAMPAAAPAPVAAAPVAAAPAAPAPARSGPSLVAAHVVVPPGGFRIQYDRSRSLDDLLTQASRVGASDLHVHSLAPLRMRVNGSMEDCSAELLDPEHARRLILTIFDDHQRKVFEERMQLDFAYTLPGVGRFRANAYMQQRGTDAVFRIIPEKPPTLAELGLPANLERVIQFHQGMVLFTGPAGCGKSSTMAAMTKLVNESRPDHIITVEDPIEYVHASANCLVNQRQVGPHTESFARALRAALREDPDVIVIGELRDLETISLALTAAETGHLVLGSLHTSSAVRTVNRLLGVFPPEQQAQIRTMVSESLRAVVSQRLLARADGKGRVPALEVMINNKAVGNLIRESKTFQIPSQIQTDASAGMVLLDASLMELYKSGVVTAEEARKHAEDPKKFV